MLSPLNFVPHDVMTSVVTSNSVSDPLSAGAPASAAPAATSRNVAPTIEVLIRSSLVLVVWRAGAGHSAPVSPAQRHNKDRANQYGLLTIGRACPLLRWLRRFPARAGAMGPQPFDRLSVTPIRFQEGSLVRHHPNSAGRQPATIREANPFQIRSGSLRFQVSPDQSGRPRDRGRARYRPRITPKFERALGMAPMVRNLLPGWAAPPPGGRSVRPNLRES